MTPAPQILIVEDDPLTLDILKEYLSDEGYRLEAHASAEGAWEALTEDPDSYDAVVMDRGLPDLDGIEILKRIKDHPRLCQVPVILATGAKANEEILEGLRAGAYYYLTKPYDEEMLSPIVRAAVGDRRRCEELQTRLQHHARVLGLMEEAFFRFQTLDEATSLAVLLASACPDPDRVVTGLSELLINAVEHGNLGITYADKSSLVAQNRWKKEVERRLELPENRDKYVEVQFLSHDDSVEIVIRDQGPGFDWEDYLEVKVERAFHSHGRGIAMARQMSFDSLEFMGQGNEVRVSVGLS